MGEYQEKVEKIKETVGRKSLFIQRVPEQIKTRFMELAKAEFEDDYGMLLKKLVEVYDGFYPTGHEGIEAKIDILAEEVAKIQEQLKIQQEKKPVKRMLSGRIIEGGRK